MSAITLDGVSKLYRRYGRQRRFATLKSALLTGSLVRHLHPDESFRALDDVSLTVEAGTTCGIIGRNGSGKSTLLKLVAGITRPTRGQVAVRGRVSALIELGAGFHPEISGRENVFINGVMLGMSRREIDRRFDEIVDFAELDDFIDAPVKTYSSGMYMRLGFAVAVHVDPEVLLVDEVLAVGDESFSLKCLDKFAEFKRRGKTILLVTHSLSLVERFCDAAVWLDAGRKRMVGDPRRVVQTYLSDVEQAEAAHLAAGDAKAQQLSANRPGEDVEPTGDARPVGTGARQDPAPPAAEPVGASVEGGEPAPAAEAALPGDLPPPAAEAARTPGRGADPMTPPVSPAAEAAPPSGPPVPPAAEAAPSGDSPPAAPGDQPPADMFKAAEGRWGSGAVRIDQVTIEGRQGPAQVFRSGEPLTVRMRVSADRPVADFAFGIGIFSADGVCCYGTNTHLEELEPERLDGAGEVAFVIERLDLVGGTYKLDVAVHRREGFSYDYHRLLYTFRVKSSTGDVGIYRPPHAWQFSENIRFKPRP